MIVFGNTVCHRGLCSGSGILVIDLSLWRWRFDPRPGEVYGVQSGTRTDFSL